MDEYATARQHLAQTVRTLQLVNFRFMQLRHTNDQLLAGLQDLLAQANLMTQARPAPDGDAPRPLFKKDFP